MSDVRDWKRSIVGNMNTCLAPVVLDIGVSVSKMNASGRWLLGIRGSRRAFLMWSTAALTTGVVHAAWPQVGPTSRQTVMNFEDLFAKARVSAQRAYVAPIVPDPALIEKVDYSAHWQIQFREDATLFPAGPRLPVQLFHPGRYFSEPVAIHVRD